MRTTVLIVDDHLSFRATARALLEAEGFEVVGEAADGAAALELVAQVHPEVVLLDVQLPDLDGFEVAARLTANGAAATEQAHQALLAAGATPTEADAVTADYGNAELDALKTSMLIVALLAVLSFWFTRRLPGRPTETAA